MNVKEGIIREIYKPARKNFLRKHVVTKGLYDLYQSDLIDLQSYAKYNNNYKYILVVIDVYSKYAWARALNNKTGKEVSSAMRNILSTLPQPPANLQTDHGSEFYNVHFKALMRSYNINHYSVYSTKKACVVERFIRTFKTLLFKQFALQGSYTWVSCLVPLLNMYNNTYHRTIKMKPKDVSDNSLLHTVYKQTFNNKLKPKFKIGDFVRVSKFKTVFQKGYLPSWSAEVFKIKTVLYTHPITYLLTDLSGNAILGAFYTHELQTTRYPDTYLVEKVLQSKHNKVLVKWLGFSSSHNSWINKSSLV